MSADLMLDDIATQVGFAALVGASQPAIHKHVTTGVLVSGETYREWLAAYCERLRTEAAGRTQTAAREQRDVALARQAQVRASLDERELFKQDGLILDAASVKQAMLNWIALAKNEVNNAFDRMITTIESEHEISIDRTQVQPDIDAAYRSIADYRFESGTFDSGSG